MYRLHIDIPLNYTEKQAIELSDQITLMISRVITNHQINYRLGNDEDRQKSNYLTKNANGHVSNKKCIILPESCLTFDDPIV